MNISKVSRVKNDSTFLEDTKEAAMQIPVIHLPPAGASPASTATARLQAEAARYAIQEEKLCAFVHRALKHSESLC